MLCLIILLLTQSFETKTKTIFDAAVLNSIKEYCPFNDMHGLNKLCPIDLHNDQYLPIKLGTGWDPIDGSIKLPFFKLTYLQNKFQVIKGIKYRIPDQVAVSIGNINTYTVTNNTYTTLDQYLSKMDPSRTNVSSGQLSLPIDMIPELFKFFDTGHSNIVTVIETIKAYNMKFDNINKLEISPFTQSAIDSLPAVYDKELYSLFINYWGTQVVVNADAGGIAEQTVMIKSCFGGIDASSQAALYMMHTFNPEQYSNVSFQAGFQQYSRASIIDIYGGDPKYVNLSDWKLRVSTMDMYPVITNVQTRPITDFIINKTIKANLLKAISDKYAEGNTRIAKYKQEYLNSLKGGRLVTYVGVLQASNNILSTQQMTLNGGTGAPIPKSAWSKWTPTSDYEGFYCIRSTDSTIRSGVDYTFMASVMAKENPYGFGSAKWSAITPNGVDTGFGCSASAYSIDTGHMTSIAPFGSYTIVGYCCMDCIPDIRCDKYCHLYGCGCPAF